MRTMINCLSRLHPLALAGAVLLLLAVPDRAHAAFVLTLTQTGGNVVANGSGTLNLNALTLLGVNSEVAQIDPARAILFAGPTSGTNTSVYNGGGLAGPSAFGTRTGAIASAGTGSFVGIYGTALDLYVPQGYVSGTALTDNATFNNATFASLGFTPGTYTYTWGTGANADSLTVTGVVPEPSTWAAIAVGAGSLGLVLRRRAHTARLQSGAVVR